jgi:cell wall-associated NlpC family hydrolase
VARPESSPRPARALAVSTDCSAAPRRSRWGGRVGSGLVVATVAGLLLTVLPGSASATPGGAKAGTAAEATRLVADATHELEVVTEQLNDARVALTAQQDAVAAADAALATAQAQVDALAGEMRQVARSAFTGENLSRFNALMTSDSAEDFLAQVSTLDAIAGHTGDVIAQAAAAAQTAQQAKAQAEVAAAEAQRTLEDVTARQAALQTQIADYQGQYETLTAAQRQAVVAEHAGPVLEAPPTVVAPSGAVQSAIDTAMAQLGDPYVWGAGGPNAFDCSGLTQYAYAAAGITLPHSSKVQSTMGTAVPRSQLQPGDLVFFYSPVSHVGMYIGKGQMVHASTFGSPVLVTSVDMAGYVGARRLVG